jgi:hypothetical protein
MEDDPILDSGASNTFITTSDARFLTNLRKAPPLNVTIPNGDSMCSQEIGNTVPIMLLPSIEGRVFPPGTLTRSLVSVADYTLQGYRVEFDDQGVYIRDKHNITVFTQLKPPGERLWRVPNLIYVEYPRPGNTSTTQAQEATMATVVRHQPNAEFVAYWHAALGSPTIQTLINALNKGYLRTLPRLTAQMVHKNPPVSDATAIGHLDLTRQHAVMHPDMNQEQVEEDCDATANMIFTRSWDIREANHSDATGRFPVQSLHGNNYLLVSVYHGYIHLEPMKSRTSVQYINAYSRTLNHFARLGTNIELQLLDNETSDALEDFFRSRNIQFQYVPPHNHRANRAERAIRDVKNHLIAILATTHKEFPLYLWDELLEQAQITLNSLRPFARNPDISAYHGIHGTPYDFIAHPIAPCGMQVVIHKSTLTRGSWDPHGVRGYYLGPALQHYRSYKTYSIPTHSIVISDTVAWLPDKFIMPGSSLQDRALAALEDLHHTLRDCANKQPSLIASKQPLDLVDTCTASLRQVYELLLGTPPRNNMDTVDREAYITGDRVQRVIGPPPGLPAPSHPLLPGGSTPTSSFPTAVQDESSPIASIQPSGDTNPLPSPAEARTSEERIVPPTPLPPTGSDGSESNDRHCHSTRQLYQRRGQHNSSKDRPWWQTTVPQVNAPAIVTTSRGRLSKPTSRYITENLQAVAFTAVDLDLAGAPLTYKSAITGPERLAWMTAAEEEFDRLIEVTGTMRFIHRSEVPRGRRPSYYNPQIKKKIKDNVEVYRVRGTIGGELVHYPGECAAWTADIATIKLLLNAVVSEGAAWMTADIKDFYLNTILPRKEYMTIPRHLIPEASFHKYNLQRFGDTKTFTVEISKGIYGLPQAGRLAQERLTAHLGQHGYYACPSSPCLFRHETRPIAFTLVVDDFGIKYKGKEHAEHLLWVLRQLYEVTVDWAGRKYVGITVDIDQTQRIATISMPGYIDKALTRFGVTRTSNGTHSPIVYIPPKYGASSQADTAEPHPDTTIPLDAAQTKRIQQIIGVLLYYARAVDPTLLTALNKIAAQQTNPTMALQRQVDRVLQYAASYPTARVSFHASDMRLMVHSDASYLSEPNSRSRAGGAMYLAAAPCPDDNTDTLNPSTTNGLIEYISVIPPTVAASAAEAEYIALFLNAQTAAHLRNVLHDLGYPQPATPIICDNQCATGIANRNVRIKRSKAIQMRYHWVRDRVDQGEFTVIWKPGHLNLADFFTKAHPVHHHQLMRGIFLDT